MFYFYILGFLWFIRTTKAVLFWLYLWQLKEYRIGRFLDHFQTEKGKRLLIDKIIFIKLFLVFGFLLYFLINGKLEPFFLLILVLLYFLESVKVLKDFFQKKLRKPVLTEKTLVLISTGLILQIFFLFILFQNIDVYLVGFAFGLLVFDILTPVIASVIVLFFQPLTVLLRNQIIKKAERKREQFKNLLVIGITGSYGKTSTKEFLTIILSSKFNVLKTKENQNSEIGISQCILNDLKPGHEIFVCEMGAYNKGEIKLLSGICKPQIGIITGVNEQHLALFGSMENLISAEGGQELIENLPDNGLAIFNGNNKDCQKLYQKINLSKKKIIFRHLPEILSPTLSPDLWTENIRVEKEWLFFKVFSKDKDFAEFKVNLIGVQNIENILLAVACAKELRIKLEKISKAIRNIKPIQGGVRLKKGVGGIDILESTYSANPNSVIAHLEHLKLWPGQKIIVMPCLIELGAASKEVHKRIGKKIGEICDLAIIISKDRFREINEGVMESGRNPNILFLENPKSIFEKVSELLGKKDSKDSSDSVILLEGRISQSIVEQLMS